MQGDTENSWFFDESRRRFEIKQKIMIFMQNHMSALNNPPLHASYFKFIENFIQQLVSYAYLK